MKVGKYIPLIVFLVLLLMGCKSKQVIKSAKLVTIKEIKHLNYFFGVSNFDPSDTTVLRPNLNFITFFEDYKDSELRKWLVPVLIKDLKTLALKPISEKRKIELFELSILVSRIWQNEDIIIRPQDSQNTTRKKVNKAIDIYHELCQTDIGFYDMLYKEGKGPFYGFDVTDEYKLLDKIDIQKNQLIIRGQNNQYTLELINETGDLKWRKLIAESEHQLKFPPKPIIIDGDLGPKIQFHGTTGNLYLYLRSNGDFKLMVCNDNHLYKNPIFLKELKKE